MVSVAARLRVCESFSKTKHATAREGDNRLGSKHSRMNRGIVRHMVGDHEVVYFPAKAWPAHCGISLPTLRLWMRKSVFVAKRLYGMPVMCQAEMHALRASVTVLWTDRSKFCEVTPQFTSEVRASLLEVRNALDVLHRRQELTTRQKQILSPSVRIP